MRQAQKKKEKDKIAIALMLAFCVIALTSIFTIKSNIDKIRGTGENVPVSENAKASSEDTAPGDMDKDLAKGNISGNISENIGKTARAEENTDAQVSGKLAIIDSKDSGSSAHKKSESNFINPVNCDSASVSNEYSMDKLIYSVTLDQYMTHCGIDIEAPEDTQVVAAAAGTVTAVYQDDRYGLSVEITHENNLVTVYSNLSTNEMVEVGDTVKQGKIIGGVGSSALFESLEPAHLHFEMRKDGAYVNPAKYLGL